MDYADIGLVNKSENRLISLPNGVRYANDVVKICLAWKYGIVKDKFKVFEFQSVQEYTFHMWVNGNKSVDEIIRELTRQKKNRVIFRQVGDIVRSYNIFLLQQCIN